MKQIKKLWRDLSPVSKGLLFTIILLIIGCIVIVLAMRSDRLNKEKDNECICHKYKKFKQNTVYPDGRYDVKIDSICTIYSIGGTIVSKQFQ